MVVFPDEQMDGDVWNAHARAIKADAEHVFNGSFNKTGV